MISVLEQLASKQRENMPVKQELYGGAIVTVIPDGFLDASMLREVPDTQEVFVNSRKEQDRFEDGLGTNESVIVDLLQRVSEQDNRKALDVHIREVSSINGTNEWRLLKLDGEGTSTQTCVAVESALKWGKEDMRETLVLCLALIRLEDVETDVIITVNVPIDDASELEELDQWVSDDTRKPLPPRVRASYAVLKQMVQEFRIIDESLFV